MSDMYVRMRKIKHATLPVVKLTGDTWKGHHWNSLIVVIQNIDALFTLLFSFTLIFGGPLLFILLFLTKSLYPMLVI